MTDITKSLETAAEEHINSTYFKLEYSSFGTTAKECKNSFLAGATWRDSHYLQCLDDIKSIYLAEIKKLEARLLEFEGMTFSENKVIEELKLRAQEYHADNLKKRSQDSAEIFSLITENQDLKLRVEFLEKTYLKNDPGNHDTAYYWTDAGWKEFQELKSELKEQCRINGIGQQRELALETKLKLAFEALTEARDIIFQQGNYFNEQGNSGIAILLHSKSNLLTAKIETIDADEE